MRAGVYREASNTGSELSSRGVPGARHVVRNVLSRLANAETPIIGRAAPGIYWRQPPPAADDYGALPVLTPCATSILAPVGSGYASDCALSELGWSTQMPYRTTVAVPYRNLTPPECPLGPPLTFAYRSNQRRRELNWNEATLLEAALRSHLAKLRPPATTITTAELTPATTTEAQPQNPPLHGT